MNEQKVQQAKQLLNDYVLSKHQKIENWFSSVSKQDFNAELILLCLEGQKFVDAFDVVGIALSNAMTLFLLHIFILLQTNLSLQYIHAGICDSQNNK